MNKKKWICLLAAAASLSMASCGVDNEAVTINHKEGAASEQKTGVSELADEDTLYQYSTYSAFAQGTYNGLITSKDFLTYGDTGIGIADGLDGAMVAADGVMYKIGSDGTATECEKNDKIAYGAVTTLNGSRTQSVLEIKGYKNFCDALSNQIILNQICIARIDGKFSSVKLSCPSAQSEPYKPYEQASKDNVAYRYKDISGTVIAVYYPEFYEGISQSGWQMYFISEDKTKGGIVSDIHITEGKCIIEKTSKFSLETPQTDEFNKLTLKAGGVTESDTDDEESSQEMQQ